MDKNNNINSLDNVSNNTHLGDNIDITYKSEVRALEGQRMDDNKYKHKQHEYYYIYNPDQCNFYLNNGLIPLKFGVGKQGDAYLKFKNNERLQEVFKRWTGKE